MGTEHTTIIRRFIHHNLRIHFPVHKLFAQQTNGPGNFPIGCRRTFLLRSYPVPMPVRFIERAYIVKLNSILPLYSFYYICQKTCILLVTVRFQVCRPSTTGISSQTVLSIIHRRRIKESKKLGNTPFLCQFQEVTLSLLLIPVVRSVRLQKTFGTHPR